MTQLQEAPLSTQTVLGALQLQSAAFFLKKAVFVATEGGFAVLATFVREPRYTKEEAKA